MNLIFILKTICNKEFTYMTKARLAQSGFFEFFHVLKVMVSSYSVNFN